MTSRSVEKSIIKSQRAFQKTQEKLDLLSKTAKLAKEKFHKELCVELAKDEDLEDPRENYESLYVDIINRWTEEVHNIEVNITQLTEWIDHEARDRFKDLYMKKQRTLLESLNDHRKDIYSQRLISAKIPHAAVNEQTSHDTSLLRFSKASKADDESIRDTQSRQESRDLLTVKLNRTMKLRKAENQRRQKANEADPFTFSTKSKCARKKLDEYKLRYVYDRLHETPTYASNCQRRARNSARGRGLFQQHSITTVKTLPLSPTQTPVKVANARFGSGRPNKPNEMTISMKQCFLPPLRDKMPLVSQGGSQSTTESDNSTTKVPSRLPRPFRERKTNKSESVNQTKVNRKEESKLDRKSSDTKIKEKSDPLLRGKPEQRWCGSSAVGTDKKTGNYFWKKLLKNFPAKVELNGRSDKLDDFSDIKSSFVDAQKIYGHPKPAKQSKKKRKKEQKAKKIENTDICDQNQEKKSKTYNSTKSTKPITCENLTKPDTPANEPRTQNEDNTNDALNLSVKNTGIRSLFTRSAYKKPKSAMANAQVKPRVDTCSLIKETERSSNSVKMEPRKSKSDNSLETNKESNENKVKKKSKSELRSQENPPSMLTNDADKAPSNDASKEQDIGPGNILTKPARQIRHNTKQKTRQAKVPYVTNGTTKSDMNNGKPTERVNQVPVFQKAIIVIPRLGAPKSRNKPKSTMVRNAIAEAEELNPRASTGYIFTKFSDQEADKVKLAKLDEKFKLQKARIETAVIRNQRDTSEHNGKRIAVPTELSDSEVSLTKEESSSSVGVLPSDFIGTALLKRRIDKLKEDLIRKTLETEPISSDVTATSSSPSHGEQASEKNVLDEDTYLSNPPNVAKVFPNRAMIHRV